LIIHVIIIIVSSSSSRCTGPMMVNMLSDREAIRRRTLTTFISLVVSFVTAGKRKLDRHPRDVTGFMSAEFFLAFFPLLVSRAILSYMLIYQSSKFKGNGALTMQ